MALLQTLKLANHTIAKDRPQMREFESLLCIRNPKVKVFVVSF